MSAQKTPKNHPKGENHPRAVLTDADVELMRQLREAGWTLGDLADKFECGKSTVFDITTYRKRNGG